MEIRKEEEF